MIRILTSPHAETRLAAARNFIAALPRGTEILVLAASREAADDFARGIARDAGAIFGLHRLSLTQFAATLAASAAARLGRAPVSRIGSEALAARAVFQVLASNPDAVFRDSARFPGFPRAVESSITELRLAGVTPERLADVETDPFLAPLLREYEAALEAGRLTDRADLFRAAAQAVGQAPAESLARGPILMLDVVVTSAAEADFIAALGDTSSNLLAVIPEEDARTIAALDRSGAAVRLDSPADGTSALSRLRRNLFELDVETGSRLDETVTLFSAPGENRECVEIARRVLDEARRGVPFDEIAVLVRNPYLYWGHLEQSFRRGKIPAYFSRGTRRPDPGGRAFLLLLDTAREGLSAVRFAEYLSLGQVPRAGAESEKNAGGWVPPADETLGVAGVTSTLEHDVEDSTEHIAGGLTPPAPWKWERLLVSSSVIGGADRWRRRLGGLKAEMDLRIESLTRLDPDQPMIDRVRRDREQLDHFTAFALPLIDALAALPESARWGEWLGALSCLAVQALHRPDRVRELLAELEPMAGVGPVTLSEVRDVLSDRLATLDLPPPASRYGRVFIGTPDQARGRSFRVVFVPGLAERVFPKRPYEDPLLLDDRRRSLGMSLAVQDDRADEERMRLRLAVGAAGERLYLSYSRFEMAEARPRVPSFYALDLIRAVTGTVPDYEVLERSAAREAGAWLAWPAPGDPALAIDDFEHDLAVLGPLLRVGAGPGSLGRARYLFELNDVLRDSLKSRWRRWQRGAWTSHDGLVRPGMAGLEALHHLRPTTRPYSVSMLQKYAVCPYQFLLAAVYRFEPYEAPVSIERMDPLTRGSLFHEVQRDVLRDMKLQNRLPVRPEGLDAAFRSVDRRLNDTAERYRDRLAPAIDRVWRDDVENLRVDLKSWLRSVAEAEETWTPVHFEYSFGLPPDGDHDPESRRDPVTLPGGFQLRGAVDLIEEGAGGALRVTDHKTGKNWTKSGLVIGGGEALQPVLYGLAVEEGLKRPVSASRLYFCTGRGRFSERPVTLGPEERSSGLQALSVIDRAVAGGFLPAAPKEGACEYCDFRPVCGPGEERRVRLKPREELRDLEQLRRSP